MDEEMTRRVADCLERHLPEYGFVPYRYPSGENKSVDLIGGKVLVSDAHGNSWYVSVTKKT